ncbi:MAG: LysR family transcriptional regulator [Ruegeria sp.]
MSYDRRSLPPLETLVFFNAVMEKGGFSAAAPDLMVSQAAVSKRIRQLEDWLGTPLFDRGARHAQPTETALKLQESVRMGLDYLVTSLEAAKLPGNQAVRIAANGAVSMFWLYPRLQRFATSAQACNVSVLTSDDPDALRTKDVDLAIYYGTRPPDGWTGSRLFPENLVPALAPNAVSHRTELPILEYPRLAPDWINWKGWADTTQSVEFEGRGTEMCRSYGHAIGKALAGEGIALASRPMLDDLFERGVLVYAGATPLQTKRSYWLIRPSSHEPTEDTSILERLLVQPDREGQSGSPLASSSG